MQFITTGNRIMTENFTVGLFYTITFLNGNILACSCNGKGDNFVSFLCVEPQMQFILDLSTAETIDTIELYGGGAGTMNYNELNNKPSINGETLVGNLTTTDLHIRAVPTIDTTDNNKVLTASYVGGVTSYSWQTLPAGTTNYNDLTNKPEINGHVLSGNQLSSQLGLATAAQGALADTAVQPATLASYQPLIDNSHKLDPALIATDTNNRFATDTQLNQIATNTTNILFLAQNTCQNLLELPTSGYELGGVTFTPNSDGSVSMSGLKTENRETYLLLQNVDFTSSKIPKKFVAFANAASVANDLYVIAIIPFIGDTAQTPIQINGNMLVDLPAATTSMLVRAKYTGTVNTTASGSIYPMICTPEMWTANPNYEIYAPTNAELYAMLKAIQ